MGDEFVILIADRNRHVREFLRRELMAEGYRVQVAKDGREVMMIIEGSDPPDLLILDLDAPYVGGSMILERLRIRNPPLPVVVHAFPTDYTGSLSEPRVAAFVEKSGDTDRLKAVVTDVLRELYPRRFAAGRTEGGEGAGNKKGPE